jgi:hypothetical protein
LLIVAISRTGLWCILGHGEVEVKVPEREEREPANATVSEVSLAVDRPVALLATRWPMIAGLHFRIARPVKPPEFV